MSTAKITPIIDPICVHNVSVDVNRALELLELDPIQSAKLLQRAINSLYDYARLARRTQSVTAPDYLFVDPNHRIFTPLYDTLDDPKN